MEMREIDVKKVEQVVRDLCIRANMLLPADLEDCIACAHKSETNETPAQSWATLRETSRQQKSLIFLFVRIQEWLLYLLKWVKCSFLRRRA
jgi:tartrate dehydratase alpha subunit/fumarate hydratase class I-like protein